LNNTPIADKAIQAVNRGKLSYCKFLSANDTGDTGAHQSGIYIAKNAESILFDKPGQPGENKDRYVKIRWQEDFETDSRFVYYGTGTRNEYRITRFGRGFPFLRTEHTGDLFVFVQMEKDYYQAYMLQTEDEINGFFNAFGMSPTDTGQTIEKENMFSETHVDFGIMQFARSLKVDFPASADMALMARNIYQLSNHEKKIFQDPDREIVSWTEIEYRLFRQLEFDRYGDLIARGFTTADQFIAIVNLVLDRRKSHAGESLEHHLSAIFDGNQLIYESQPQTENDKRPDFLFSGGTSYMPSDDKLIFLGAKTTCKDRWRQIISEAGRTEVRYLFTLQQGISTRQLDEMADENVVLVVPRMYLDSYPKEKRDGIWTLKKFISFVKEKTGV